MPTRPIELQELFSRPTRVTYLPTVLQSVEDFIRASLASNQSAVGGKRGNKQGAAEASSSSLPSWASLLAAVAVVATVAIIIARAYK
jgi:anti-sigma-K factor RskA